MSLSGNDGICCFCKKWCMECECGKRECCRKHWEQDTNQQAHAIGPVLMNPLGMPFMCCIVCGNKRCPKATDCALECTWSNKPGQPGSIYE